MLQRQQEYERVEEVPLAGRSRWSSDVTVRVSASAGVRAGEGGGVTRGGRWGAGRDQQDRQEAATGGGRPREGEVTPPLHQPAAPRDVWSVGCLTYLARRRSRPGKHNGVRPSATLLHSVYFRQ